MLSKTFDSYKKCDAILLGDGIMIITVSLITMIVTRNEAAINWNRVCLCATRLRRCIPFICFELYSTQPDRFLYFNDFFTHSAERARKYIMQ